jgi:hypothetical protein
MTASNSSTLLWNILKYTKWLIYYDLLCIYLIYYHVIYYHNLILSIIYQYDISMIYLWLIVLHLRVPWDDPGRSGTIQKVPWNLERPCWKWTRKMIESDWCDCNISHIFTYHIITYDYIVAKYKNRRYVRYVIGPLLYEIISTSLLMIWLYYR